VKENTNKKINMSRKREEELKEELAGQLRCGNTHAAFDPYFRCVVDLPYNNGASFRELAENNEVNDLDRQSDRFHDR
jgi:hypothetical protein